MAAHGRLKNEFTEDKKYRNVFILALDYRDKPYYKRGQEVGYGALVEPPHGKTNKMTVRPAKTQISLGIRPV